MNKLWIENIELLPAVEYEEYSTSAYFTDKTSDAISWDMYGKKVRPHIFVRYEIQCLLLPKCNPNYPTIDFTGWSSLTDTEKEIMARYMLAPKALRRTIYNREQDIDNINYLIEITQDDRIAIVERMRKKVYEYVADELITQRQAQQFFKDTKEFIFDYKHAAMPDLMLFITNGISIFFSEDGIDFTTTGFSSKSYYSIELKTDLMNIYNGLI